MLLIKKKIRLCISPYAHYSYFNSLVGVKNKYFKDHAATTGKAALNYETPKGMFTVLKATAKDQSKIHSNIDL